MIEVHPYSDHAALDVLKRLDPCDHIEAELVRGCQINHLQLFAEWRAVQSVGVASYVLCDTRRPGAPAFAVLAIGNTGQSGVAQAALLARNHKLFRRSLAEAALLIRNTLPGFCDNLGIHRIEARSWIKHPTAAQFLTHCGFARECIMPGFGANGAETFTQFAWLKPEVKGTDPCAS